VEHMKTQQPRKSRKRPCSICKRWFHPDPRVRHCQKTCNSPECRSKQKHRSQSAWSHRNPDYWIFRRASERIARLQNGVGVDTVLQGPPPELRCVPADLAQEALGIKGVVILEIIARVLLSLSQDAMDRQREALTEDITRVLQRLAQDAIGSQQFVINEDFGRVLLDAPQEASARGP
jgi:hypothetical protein